MNEKGQAFGGNGKYERIWWYWQKKKEYVGVCNPQKKSKYNVTSKSRNEARKDKRVGYSETKAGQSGFEPPPMLAPATFTIISQNRDVLLVPRKESLQMSRWEIKEMSFWRHP